MIGVAERVPNLGLFHFAVATEKMAAVSTVRYVLEQLGVRGLREIARGRKIKGMWSMHRDVLIAALQEVDELDEVYSMAVMFR